MRKFLLIVLALTTFTALCNEAVIAGLHELDNSYAELQCVNQYIQSVDREDIATGNGTCWVKQTNLWK